MFYVLIAEGPKDREAEMRGPYASAKAAQKDMEQADFEGPMTFTLIELDPSASFVVVAIGQLPEYPDISWT